MALIFMEGFDARDMSLRWNGGGPNGWGTGRFGTGTAAVFSANAPTKQLFRQLSQAYIGWATMSNFGSTFGHGLVVRGDNGGTAHVSVMMTASSLLLQSGGFGSTIASYSTTFTANTWYYLELWVQLATSGGRAQVRLNGNVVIDYTGNTMNGGTNTTVDSFQIGTVNSSVTDTFDDIYVCDATGTANNYFLGDSHIQTLFPSGTGSSTQFTPTGSANNYANVNDIPDATATYNSSTTVGDRDLYAMGDVLASTGRIFGVQESIHAFKTDSGMVNIKPALKSGSTLVYDPTLTLTASNIWVGTVRESDPNTGAVWTPAAINALELGGEVA